MQRYLDGHTLADYNIQNIWTDALWPTTISPDRHTLADHNIQNIWTDALWPTTISPDRHTLADYNIQNIWTDAPLADYQYLPTDTL